jgi:hypothetical protein
MPDQHVFDQRTDDRAVPWASRLDAQRGWEWRDRGSNNEKKITGLASGLARRAVERTATGGDGTVPPIC